MTELPNDYGPNRPKLQLNQAGAGTRGRLDRYYQEWLAIEKLPSVAVDELNWDYLTPAQRTFAGVYMDLKAELRSNA